MNKKSDLLNYVLVAKDTVGTGTPVYFTGQCAVMSYKKPEYNIEGYGIVPGLTTDYTQAVKLCYKDEAQTLADNINKQFDATRGNNPRFVVEEHKYFD